MITSAGNIITAGIYEAEFSAFIGILPQEKLIPQRFCVTVEVSMSAAPLAANPEDLSKTVSYAEIFEIVNEEMNHGAGLLEKIAITVGNRLVKRYPHIIEGFISILKLNPPIEGMAGKAGIKYFFKNNH